MSRQQLRRRDEAGQLAGIELLPFGLLVFVVGVLFFAQIWAVFEAKTAASSAARETTRTFVETPAGVGVAEALSDSRNAGLRALMAQGRDPGRATIEPRGPLSLDRCARATFEVEYSVPIVNLPLLSGFGDGITVRSRHSEIVDPFRDGLRGAASCA